MEPPGTLAAHQLARWLLGAGALVAGAGAALLGTGAMRAALVADAAFVVAALLVWRARGGLGERLGVANRITLVRTAVTCGLAGVAVDPVLATAPAWRWPIIAVALALAALDLADGRLARWRGEASRFGAIIDGETDAFYVLVLAVLAWHEGQVSGAPGGGVVLAIGLLRYVMLAAQAVWPRLRGQVPSSPAGKWICAAQIAALIWALGPGTPARDVLCWLALAGLVWSFSRDVRYLLTARR